MKKHASKAIYYIGTGALAFVVIMPYFISYVWHKDEYKKEEEKYQQALNKELIDQDQTKEVELKQYLLGKFDPSKRDDFILLSSEHTLNGITGYLRKETYAGFLAMENSASLEGINLKVLSATRNFDYQKDLWEEKWNGTKLVDGENLAITLPNTSDRFKKILEYSAVPGTSRHHWGTEIDLNHTDPKYFETEQGKKEYAWLKDNAYKFGFCQVYNEKNKNRLNGYEEEKWHWSFMPLSYDFTVAYEKLIKETDIKGFAGDQHVSKEDLIKNYVLSLNPECFTE